MGKYLVSARSMIREGLQIFTTAQHSSLPAGWRRVSVAVNGAVAGFIKIQTYLLMKQYTGMLQNMPALSSSIL